MDLQSLPPMVRSRILQLTESELEHAIHRCNIEMTHCLNTIKDGQPGAIMGYGDFFIEREIYQEAYNVKRAAESGIQVRSE